MSRTVKGPNLYVQRVWQVQSKNYLPSSYAAIRPDETELRRSRTSKLIINNFLEGTLPKITPYKRKRISKEAIATT